MRQCQYPVLEKKISQLRFLIRSLSSNSHLAAKEDEIAGRITFLKTLLAAEMESNALAIPNHLHHIAHWLALLGNAFRKWTEFGTLGEDDGLDAISTCSCTEVCFNEGEGDREQRQFRGRGCSIIGLAMVVAMAAVAVGAVKNLYIAEQNDFLVPT